jgi:hypothetical protein
MNCRNEYGYFFKWMCAYQEESFGARMSDCPLSVNLTVMFFNPQTISQFFLNFYVAKIYLQEFETMVLESLRVALHYVCAKFKRLFRNVLFLMKGPRLYYTL